MALFRRSRAPVLPEATNASAPVPGVSLVNVVQAFWASVGLTGGTLEALGPVDRCLQLNAQQIATMPLRYRHAADVAGYEPNWVNDPSPEWFRNGIGDTVEAIVRSIYSRGDAFLWATSRYETGYVRTFALLDASTMRVTEEGGTRAYRSNGYELDPGDVIQITRNPTGLRGTSALAAWASSVESLSQAEAFAADVYSSSGVNRVALRSTAQRFDREQALQLQADWVEAVGRRLGAPAIIPRELEFVEALSISPKDLMLLESREWDTRMIAAAHGVPAILLNVPMTGSLVYQNPAELLAVWWRTELAPVAVKIARALSRWVPRGHWVEFDQGQALRPDLPTAIDVATKAVTAGLLTEAEARAWVFDLPPLPEGEAEEEIFEEEGGHASAQSSNGEVPASVVIA